MSSSTSPPPGSAASPASSFTVTSPADILSYVPHALGFLPEESLVMLTTNGRRLGATLRVDLPKGGTDPRAFAEGVLSFLEGDTEGDGSLVVLYTNESWSRLAAPPRKALIRSIESVLGAAGLPVRGGWLVSATVWRDYFCTDARCCAWPGEPIDTVVYSPLNAELIYGGSSFDASVAAAVVRAAPAVAGQAWRGQDGGGQGIIEDRQAMFAASCAGRWTTPDQFRATAACWDAVLPGPRAFDVDAEPELTGFLLASIESRTVRDFLLVSACLGSAAALRGAAGCGLLDHSGAGDGSDGDGGAGGRTGPGWVLPDVRATGDLSAAVRHAADQCADKQEGTEPAADRQSARGADAGVIYADVLAGRHTGPIDWARVDGMSAVLARLTAVADGESRAAALTMSAWFEYARGRGSRAAVYLDAAERAVPGYRLARLLQELLRRGGLPGWALSRTTAWRTGTVVTSHEAA